MPWITDLWLRLLEICPIPSGIEKLSIIPRQYKWNVTIIDEDKENNCNLKPDYVDMYDGCCDAVFDKPFITNVLVSIFK